MFRTRGWPDSAEIDLVGIDGQTATIELDPILKFQMKGLGHGHPQWGQGMWKGELEIGGELFDPMTLNPLARENVHVQQVVRARQGDETGIGVLEQSVLRRHGPAGFTGFLDGAKGQLEGRRGGSHATVCMMPPSARSAAPLAAELPSRKHRPPYWRSPRRCKTLQQRSSDDAVNEIRRGLLRLTPFCLARSLTNVSTPSDLVGPGSTELTVTRGAAGHLREPARDRKLRGLGHAVVDHLLRDLAAPTRWR